MESLITDFDHKQDESINGGKALHVVVKPVFGPMEVVMKVTGRTIELMVKVD